MDDIQSWAWLLKTTQGDFFVTVVGTWNQAEAARMVWAVFDRMNDYYKAEIGITGMIPRKRPTGPEDRDCTIWEREEPEGPENYFFLAGKKLWELCGLAAFYDVGEILRVRGERGDETVH